MWKTSPKAMATGFYMKILTFSIPKNAIVGIIGPNGVGKSTLFRMIMGQEQPDKGAIKIGDTVQVSYVDQNHEQLQDGEDGIRRCFGGQ
jgi:sulfate-transporting ATPase